MMMQPTSLRKFSAGSIQNKHDLLAVEEPLEIRLIHRKKEFPLVVTMRTPGLDQDLSLGFLYSEGIVQSMDDILNAGPCEKSENIFKIQLVDDLDFDPQRNNRYGVTSSSCGVCGKTSIENIKVKQPDFGDVESIKVSSDIILSLSELMKREQETFTFTGGLHACGLFNSSGNLLSLFEDVGRHNAFDKMLGELFNKRQIPMSDKIVLLSGRASFELLQKAAMGGVQVVAAIGAPSSLAVEVAENCGITLIGFLREKNFNIYTHPQRINHRAH